MSYTKNLNAAVPANTDLVKNGAGVIRDIQTAIIERLSSFFSNIDTDPLTIKSGASTAGAFTVGGALTITGALSGVTTLVTSSTINSQTISATANFTGTLTVATGLTVSAGTSAFAAVTMTSTLSGATSLGVVGGGALIFSGRSQIQSSADGKLILFDAAGTAFSLLQFGGTSSSFPALKRSSAALSARLADDSADAVFTGSRLVAGADISAAVAKGVFGSGTYDSTNDVGVSSLLGAVSFYINAATGNTFMGLKSQFVQSAAAASTNSYALHSQLTATHTSGTLPTAVGGDGAVNIVGSGGTTTNAISLMAQSVVGAGATVTTLTGLQVRTGLGITGTATNVLGIDVLDITAGGSLNIAIRTGLGLVVFGDQLKLVAGTTSRSSLNVPHGSAPTSPVNGDIWTTTAGIFVRINGATVGPLT